MTDGISEVHPPLCGIPPHHTPSFTKEWSKADECYTVPGEHYSVPVSITPSPPGGLCPETRQTVSITPSPLTVTPSSVSVTPSPKFSPTWPSSSGQLPRRSGNNLATPGRRHCPPHLPAPTSPPPPPTLPILGSVDPKCVHNTTFTGPRIPVASPAGPLSRLARDRPAYLAQPGSGQISRRVGVPVSPCLDRALLWSCLRGALSGVACLACAAPIPGPARTTGVPGAGPRFSQGRSGPATPRDHSSRGPRGPAGRLNQTGRSHGDPGTLHHEDPTVPGTHNQIRNFEWTTHVRVAENGAGGIGNEKRERERENENREEKERDKYVDAKTKIKNNNMKRFKHNEIQKPAKTLRTNTALRSELAARSA